MLKYAQNIHSFISFVKFLLWQLLYTNLLSLYLPSENHRVYTSEPEQADEVINIVLLITFSPFCCLRGENKE